MANSFLLLAQGGYLLQADGTSKIILAEQVFGSPTTRIPLEGADSARYDLHGAESRHIVTHGRTTTHPDLHGK